MTGQVTAPQFYHGYLSQIKGGTVMENLQSSLEVLHALYTSVPRIKETYAYADGKWTIKEVILHVTDAERIFAYRALRFARFDKTDLPGFEQNDYVPVSRANERDMSSLITEFLNVRTSTIDLFGSFDEKQLKAEGTANGNRVSVEALGYIIAGHGLHHAGILKERYLAGG
jgi:hypothetical protein